jgi:ElaB/YqjD/DUF883 family membrane-anchored ribosome-binding protein
MQTKDLTDKADDAMAQIAGLRAQVDTLMREKVSPMVDAATERVGAAAQEAADTVRDRAEVLAGAVRGQPLASILIAAAVGFLLGRAGR